MFLIAWGSRPLSKVNSMNSSLNLFLKTEITVKLVEIIGRQCVIFMVKQFNWGSRAKKIISELVQLTFDTLYAV